MYQQGNDFLKTKSVIVLNNKKKIIAISSNVDDFLKCMLIKRNQTSSSIGKQVLEKENQWSFGAKREVES